MTPKVLIIAGDASEDLEVFYPLQRLQEEGYETAIASPTVKKIQLVIHDFVDNFDTYTEKLGHTIKSDMYVATILSSPTPTPPPLAHPMVSLPIAQQVQLTD